MKALLAALFLMFLLALLLADVAVPTRAQTKHARKAARKAAGLPQLTHNPELAARKKTKQIAAWNRRAGLRVC